MRCLVLRTSENSVTAKFTECGFSTLGPSFFDGTAPAETWAHRSDGQCQRIHLRPAHTCSAPRQGTRLCTGSSTAAKLPVERAGHSTFLLFLQVKKRADERTRTAYPCSSYEFACVGSSPYWCVRESSLSMRFSACRSQPCVHCVPACISPVAVHAWPSTCARVEASRVGQGRTEVGVGHVPPELGKETLVGRLNDRAGLLAED
jgi:hypothetical protein